MPHILIADENRTVRHVLGAILEQAGYDVQEAADGRQALQILLATLVPLTVLLDERIPQMNGWKLLRQMTDEGRVPPADRYIFMTYAPDLLPPSLCTLLRSCAIPILVKPFTIEQVLRLVKQELYAITDIRR
jgi:CheY-like chemotaxis protein